nr:flagellar biosynthesis regulator FlaF [Paracoccus sp. (in: a-proteobacteria)]
KTLNALTSQSEYGYGAPNLRPARELEYDAFSRVTRMMRQSQAPGCETGMIAAIHKNKELWMILAADLADPGNGLPDALKAQLLSLARFSLRHSDRVLAGNATSAVLIDVNISIMKGLRGEVRA